VSDGPGAALARRLHGSGVHARRVRVLAGHLAPLVPPDALLLDVGAGDGQLAALLQQARPDIRVEGLEVAVRPDSRVPTRSYDGRTLPYADGSVDAVMFVDVLHHCHDPGAVLREAVRVSRDALILKDHLRDGPLAETTLRVMDWVGNRPHGVVLPYEYWSRAQWQRAWRELGLEVDGWTTRLGLYPLPFDWIFGRGLHFVARLRVSQGATEAGGSRQSDHEASSKT
jgi:SAM-dependent methyltransferase